MSEEIKNTENTNEAPTSAEKPASREASSTAASSASSSNQNQSRDNRDNRDSRDNNRGRNDRGQRGQRVPRFRKKVCKFCHNKDMVIDYKKPEVLERFITDRGKILPRRITGTCAKHQRRVAAEIKRSRMIALLPFVEL